MSDQTIAKFENLAGKYAQIRVKPMIELDDVHDMGWELLGIVSNKHWEAATISDPQPNDYNNMKTIVVEITKSLIVLGRSRDKVIEALTKARDTKMLAWNTLSEAYDATQERIKELETTIDEMTGVVTVLRENKNATLAAMEIIEGTRDATLDMVNRMEGEVELVKNEIGHAKWRDIIRAGKQPETDGTKITDGPVV